TGSIISSGTAVGRGFVKESTGAMTLAGDNSIIGPATVAGGPLIVDGSLTTPQLTVSAPATLSGTGSVGGPVTIHGRLAPGGDDPGILRFDGDVTLTTGAVTAIRVGKSAGVTVAD